MTVQVRPTPARTWGNSIRPFQAVKPGPQLPTYTLKTWRPPVPEPLPPAPLLGLPSLLALGVLVLSQAWGLLSGRGAGRPPGGEVFYWNAGSGTIQVRYTVSVYYDGALFDTFSASHFVPGGYSYTIPMNSTAIQEVSDPPYDTVLEEVKTITISAPGGGSYTVVAAINSTPFSFYSPVSGTYKSPSNSINSHQWSVRVVDGTPEGGDPTELPERPPASVPEVDNPPAADGVLPLAPVSPAEIAELRPIPLPLPGGVDLPDPLNPQPATAPTTSPGIGQPLAPPLLRPAPAGTTVQPVTPYLPAATPSVSTTPADVHYPAPNVPITSNPPAPTLQGIAQEVGRVESKLNKLLNPATGNNFDRLELIYDTISGLFEFLTSITAGGSYTLEAPCETAEDGSPLVVEHTYDGALNSIGVLSNKIDALAALVQSHKNTRQPICKPAPPTGQPVTVQFEEV